MATKNEPIMGGEAQEEYDAESNYEAEHETSCGYCTFAGSKKAVEEHMANCYWYFLSESKTPIRPKMLLESADEISKTISRIANNLGYIESSSTTNYILDQLDVLRKQEKALRAIIESSYKEWRQRQLKVEA